MLLCDNSNPWPSNEDEQLNTFRASNHRNNGLSCWRWSHVNVQDIRHGVLLCFINFSLRNSLQSGDYFSLLAWSCGLETCVKCQIHSSAASAARAHRSYYFRTCSFSNVLNVSYTVSLILFAFGFILLRWILIAWFVTVAGQQNQASHSHNVTFVFSHRCSVSSCCLVCFNRKHLSNYFSFHNAYVVYSWNASRVSSRKHCAQFNMMEVRNQLLED